MGMSATSVVQEDSVSIRSLRVAGSRTIILPSRTGFVERSVQE
jgi:hypothetical protein